LNGKVQVREIGGYVARKGAVASLRQEDRFQELMHDPAVREGVDAVIANPENVTRVRSENVMYCLNKLKQLRDISRQHGGGAINLPEILTPWSPADDEEARGMRL
jgi:hypothetical protein